MKLYIIIGVAVVVLLFSAFRYVDNASEQEFKVDKLQEEINTYQRVEEAVNESRQSNPSSDPNIALDELRERLGTP